MSEPADLPSLSWGNDREIYVVFCKVCVRFILRVWEEQNDELHCTVADSKRYVCVIPARINVIRVIHAASH